MASIEKISIEVNAELVEHIKNEPRRIAKQNKELRDKLNFTFLVAVAGWGIAIVLAVLYILV